MTKDGLLDDNVVVDGPDIVEHELNKDGFPFLALRVHFLLAQDTLRLWIEVPVAPKHFVQVFFFETKLCRVQLSEPRYPKSPSIDSRSKQDVSLGRIKVQSRVVSFFERLIVVFLFVCVLICCPVRFPLPSVVFFHPIASIKRTYDRIDVFDDARQVMVSFCRRQFELQNEPVELVDDQNRFQI